MVISNYCCTICVSEPMYFIFNFYVRYGTMVISVYLWLSFEPHYSSARSNDYGVGVSIKASRLHGSSVSSN